MHKYFFIRFILAFFKSRQQLIWENAFLRYQLAVARRKRKRIWFRNWDRSILVWFSRGLANWKQLLQIVQPETLIRWHRKGFALIWMWRYGRPPRGRHDIAESTKKLIREMALSNPLWGAPRIHGELLKLGIRIAPSTVQKYMPPRKYNPSQG